MKKIAFVLVLAGLYCFQMACKKKVDEVPDAPNYQLPLVTTSSPNYVSRDTIIISGTYSLQDPKYPVTGVGFVLDTVPFPTLSPKKPFAARSSAVLISYFDTARQENRFIGVSDGLSPYFIYNAQQQIFRGFQDLFKRNNLNLLDSLKNFKITFSGLAQGTTYYIRAFARTDVGLSYGDHIVVATKPNKPSLKLNAFTYISSNTTVCGLNTIAANGSKITQYGIVWSDKSTPTVDTNSPYKIVRTDFQSSTVDTLWGLKPLTRYYVKGYAVNSLGIFYTNTSTFTTAALPLGKDTLGGYVFYIDGTGKSGMIVSKSDIVSPDLTYPWYNNGQYSVVGGLDTSLGKGDANTNSIVNSFGIGNYAAYMCYQYGGGGFSDWFLPSYSELNTLIKASTFYGGLSNGTYWSSSEFPNGGGAYSQATDNLDRGIGSSAQKFIVRPIRKFKL